MSLSPQDGDIHIHKKNQNMKNLENLRSISFARLYLRRLGIRVLAVYVVHALCFPVISSWCFPYIIVIYPCCIPDTSGSFRDMFMVCSWYFRIMLMMCSLDVDFRVVV